MCSTVYRFYICVDFILDLHQHLFTETIKILSYCEQKNHSQTHINCKNAWFVIMFILMFHF